MKTSREWVVVLPIIANGHGTNWAVKAKVGSKILWREFDTLDSAIENQNSVFDECKAWAAKQVIHTAS